jgi:glycogen operon protein
MGAAFRLSAGEPHPLGVTLDAHGINVAVWSAHATSVMICLFDADDRETARIVLPERTGDVHHGHIAGINSGQRYGLRAAGPHAPREGHRFNAHKLLLDPYAALIDRPFALHSSMFGHKPGHPDADLSFDDADSAPFMPKALAFAPATRLRPKPITPWNRTVLYEMHVRGFTRLHPKVPDARRGTFAGLAHPAPLRHLAELGISSVELLPVAAWLDERHLGPLGLTNYWGYNPVAFGAPDPRLSPGGWDEIRECVEKLEAAEIETILDVVLNHTGEGDHLGPTVSLRGLDNASYYRLDPADPRLYANDAGCGNTLALERPAVLALAMASLRRFAELGGVHGFRFDLATTLGRRATGFDPEHPLLSAIAQDPVLGGLKLIAEPWDIGMGGYQLGRFPAEWGEWNDRYRDTARRFWRGDAGLLGDMATRVAGSADVFAARQRPLSRSINFITAHDGFTLGDLVSHAHKHNDGNGEDNRDGTDANQSWNHGTEGASDDPGIIAARMRDARALLATLLLSRGTPMLSMGDELGRSQGGNNNAYAQDNETSWLDWSRADHELIAHARALIAARLSNAALHADAPLTGHATDSSGIPDVEWLRADGQRMQSGDWENPHNRLLIAALHAVQAGQTSRAVIAINASPDAVRVALPEARASHGWARPGNTLAESSDVVIPARSVELFTEAPSKITTPARTVDHATLDQLCAAAGISHDWWDMSGNHHAVTPEVKQALLAAMRLPAATTGDARASLMRLAGEREGRSLPMTLVARAGRPAALTLAPGNGRQVMLHIQGADGEVTHWPIAPDTGEPAQVTGVDGRHHARRVVPLPALEPGRHTMRLQHAPDTTCELIIAPARCWLPEILNRQRFGIAAHLYTLRRTGDQGIADFTTLTEFGAEAARAGAVTLGLNPVHALFAHDRGRASPYHPSDRRFLDPIYIDVTSGPFAEAPSVRNALVRNEALFQRLSALDAVDYPAVWQAKREVLHAAFSAMQHAAGNAFSALQQDFSNFIAQGGEDLAGFAAFEAISAHQRGKPWQTWPQGLRDADPAAIAGFVAGQRSEVRFAQFQQWLAERAFADATAGARLDLGFYRDLAVGSAPDGAEAWAGQKHFASGVSIGAPPDPFAANGQVWNVPAPDPNALQRDGYRSVGKLVAANMRHAGALRIDHAMGLSRLFWVPEGAGARDGAYVGYDLADQLGVLALESRRARCLVIGEDLGTVPDGFREAMDDAAVLSYRALWLERRGAAFKPPADYPARSSACIGTHDLPTLAGWWHGTDISELEGMQLISADEAEAARHDRDAEKQELLAALRHGGFEPGSELDDALSAMIHAFVAGSPACLMLVQADDLAGDPGRINLPGTDRERPNWRRKLKPDIADMLATPLARSILAAVRSHRG